MARRVIVAVVIVVAFVAVVFTVGPVPQCESPYGVRDVDTCIAADGYAYRHGVQVG